MVFDSPDKYDAILVAIALTAVPMISGIFVTPIMTVGFGVVAAGLVGVAMFGLAPSDPQPKSLSTTSPFNEV